METVNKNISIINKEENLLDETSACINHSEKTENNVSLLKYSAVGILFGIVFVKAEIISWFRIQEMFKLQSFHMYGVIGTAVFTGILSVAIIKKFNIKTIQGENIVIVPKHFTKGQIYGGLLFGLGWAMTGACPGPLFAQIGTGSLSVLVVIASALLGTWTYGYFKEKLPH
jgi:uncharacterized membrane protein YedE/YeeE